jgi:predicted MFS family arabinose efflux permease
MPETSHSAETVRCTHNVLLVRPDFLWISAVSRRASSFESVKETAISLRSIIELLPNTYVTPACNNIEESFFIRSNLLSPPPAQGKGVNDRDFLTLWTGQTLSVFGSAVSLLALPSVAILLLHATAWQLGILEALGYAAFPVLGLVVGVLADRMPRRRIMIAADILRVLPLAAARGLLSFAQLACVALIAGIGSVFFEISYQSYLPAVVAKSELSRANARLEATRSAAQVAGNGLAGLLISTLGAALAVGVDAFSFVCSVASLLAIRGREAPHARLQRGGENFYDDLRAGIACVFESPVLRMIAGCTATVNFGSSMLSAVFLIFAYRDLHVSAVTLGLVLACANVGFIGAAFATRLTRRFGLGTTLAASMLCSGLAPLLLPLALYGAPIAVLLIVELLQTCATPIYNINQVSLRQTIVAHELQGRMNATMRTLVWGTMPFGALAGGALGSSFGVVPTIFVAGAITSSACLWIICGPVRRLRSIET